MFRFIRLQTITTQVLLLTQVTNLGIIELNTIAY